ncbi:MAG TPA: 4-alpha-glucanotransferase, partial [Dehalococcoidia bacterium]|nr:4-alpha-glucanotransferase [Dehalococcoidia bacterium]
PLAESLASFDTHDLPTFVSFWKGRPDRESLERYLHRLGFLETVPPLIDEVLRACLRFLASSPARAVMVNLEDLWLETQQQNRPGTGGPDEPNWRRRARLSLEEMQASRDMIEMLTTVNRLRSQRHKPYPERVSGEANHETNVDRSASPA